jgi:hypothetical protein
MIRARTCFLACQFGEEPTPGKRKFLHLWREKQANKRTRQLFSEVLIAEDIDLGSRIHALGYKSVFLDEVLALGEVPHAPRDFWKQRSRWHKAAHLYILDRHSVFWRVQPYMTFYQKSLYCIPMILHVAVFLSEPFMFTLPLVCLCFGVCPYGMDIWLWATHFLKLFFNFLISTHADTIAGRVAALQAQTASRVVYFISVKAVLNTIMVYIRWKRPGAFKVTKKAGTAPGDDGGHDHNAAPHANAAHMPPPLPGTDPHFPGPSRAPSYHSMHGPTSPHGVPNQYAMQYPDHLISAQEAPVPDRTMARGSHPSRYPVAGALAEGREQHMGPGNRGRLYGDNSTQLRFEADMRNKPPKPLRSDLVAYNPARRGDENVHMQDPRPSGGNSQQVMSKAGYEESIDGTSGPTGLELSPYEEIGDGMTMGTSTTCTPLAVTPVVRPQPPRSKS